VRPGIFGRFVVERGKGRGQEVELTRAADVLLGAEADGAVNALGRLVHPGALRPVERPLLEVTRDDVLPELRADLLDQVPQPPDHGVDPADSVATLRQVLDGQ
jgi:hypothetical protein